MKKIRTTRESLGTIYVLEGPLDGLEERIKEPFGKRLEGYEDLSVEQLYNDYSEGSHYELYGTRPMTEKEILEEEAKFLKAKEANRKEAEALRARELKTLAELKARYPEEA